MNLGWIVVGVTGREQSGRTVQAIHFHAGVIGEAPPLGAQGRGSGLESRILEVCRAGLLNVQISRLELHIQGKWTQHRFDLGHLHRIAAGNGQTLPQGMGGEGSPLWGEQRHGLNIPPLSKASGPLLGVKLWPLNDCGNGMSACAHRNNHSSPEQSGTR